MPRIHPNPEVLTGRIQLLPGDQGRLLRHIQGCPSCRRKLEEREPAARGEGNVLSWRPSETTAGRAVDGVLKGLRSRAQAVARERAEAPALLAELLGHRTERQEILARNSRRFRSLALCGLLLQRSHEVSVDDPAQGERVAALALRLAGFLDAGWYGERVLADTQGRCWSLIGNARRIAEDLPGAEEALLQAEDDLDRGTGDLTERAQLLVYKAFLRQAQHRLDEAAVLFRRTVSIFLSAGEPLQAAESIVELAQVEQDRGEPERAIQILARANSRMALAVGPLPRGPRASP
jgi:tetratricopeptide (TPR) repeat protein